MQEPLQHCTIEKMEEWKKFIPNNMRDCEKVIVKPSLEIVSAKEGDISITTKSVLFPQKDMACLPIFD